MIKFSVDVSFGNSGFVCFTFALDEIVVDPRVEHLFCSISYGFPNWYRYGILFAFGTLFFSCCSDSYEKMLKLLCSSYEKVLKLLCLPMKKCNFVSSQIDFQ